MMEQKKSFINPLVYNELTPFNLIQYTESHSRKNHLAFGNVYINDDTFFI